LDALLLERIGMIGKGDRVPDHAMRTDEGTPLALSDLKGRNLAVFMLGATFSPTVERLFDVLTRNVSRFLSVDVSPVAVIGETVESLATYRDQHDVPFLLISDTTQTVHDLMGSLGGGSPAVWLVNRESMVIDIIPMLPPTELVSVAVDRATRVMVEKSSTY
jgi:peroxiredoxin